jgi:peroxiredoxin Q/BCP
MLKNGALFPDFALQDQDGAPITKADLLGGKTIVYFYPKDDTPGCTAEACGINDHLDNFAGARVFGVSPDSPESHRQFADKYGLRFTLVSDPDHSLAEACGVWVEKVRESGEKVWGIARTSFLVDPNGVVTHVWEDVTPVGHADEIAAAL